MTKPVATRTLLASIKRGEFDDQLDSLNETVAQRLEAIRPPLQPGDFVRIEGMPESRAAAARKYNGLVLEIERVNANTVDGRVVQNNRRVSIPKEFAVPSAPPLSVQAERRKRDAAVKDEVRKTLTKKRVVRRKSR